jgi:hypothetical protein
MKKLYTILAVLFLTASAFAQAPEKMSYQAVVRDSGDALVTSQPVGMQISILQTTATGTAVYVETQTPTTNVNGLVTLEIGTGIVVSGDFTTIDWSTDSYFIKTETDPAGGTTYTITGTSQLMSVPFALYAKTSGNGAGPIGPQGLAGNGGATGATGQQGLAGNDGATGPQGLAGNDGATGLTGPQGAIGPTGPAGSLGPQGLPGVDGAGIAQILSFTSPNLVLSDNGGSIDLTGLINDADSDNSNEIQNLSQVLIEGNTAGSQLKDVTDPTDAQDATTKAYVDAKDATTDALIAALEARITALEPEQPAAIGELREGGVVFWVDPADNTHGLVCALSDYATQVAWGCTNTDLPNVPNVPFNGGNPIGFGAEIGDGINNTNNILNDCPIAPAALAARSLGAEWFLPSAKELNQMYINKTTLEAVSGFSAFSGFYYWSSTEIDITFAWVQYFGNGNQAYNDKSSTYNVRAVRAF